MIDFTGRGGPCDEVLRVRHGLGVQRQYTSLEKMGVTRTFSPRVGLVDNIVSGNRARLVPYI